MKIPFWWLVALAALIVAFLFAVSQRWIVIPREAIILFAVAFTAAVIGAIIWMLMRERKRERGLEELFDGARTQYAKILWPRSQRKDAEKNMENIRLKSMLLTDFDGANGEKFMLGAFRDEERDENMIFVMDKMSGRGKYFEIDVPYNIIDDRNAVFAMARQALMPETVRVVQTQAQPQSTTKYQKTVKQEEAQQRGGGSRPPQE